VGGDRRLPAFFLEVSEDCVGNQFFGKDHEGGETDNHCGGKGPKWERGKKNTVDTSLRPGDGKANNYGRTINHNRKYVKRKVSPGDCDDGTKPIRKRK